MFDVHAIQLLLIVGEAELAGLVGVVPPTVLDMEFGQGRLERGAARCNRVAVPPKVLS